MFILNLQKTLQNKENKNRMKITLNNNKNIDDKSDKYMCKL